MGCADNITLWTEDGESKDNVEDIHTIFAKITDSVSFPNSNSRKIH